MLISVCIHWINLQQQSLVLMDTRTEGSAALNTGWETRVPTLNLVEGPCVQRERNYLVKNSLKDNLKRTTEDVY